VGAIKTWEVGPIPITPNYTQAWSKIQGAIGGAPHGLHTDLVIGFVREAQSCIRALDKPEIFY